MENPNSRAKAGMESETTPWWYREIKRYSIQMMQENMGMIWNSHILSMHQNPVKTSKESR